MEAQNSFEILISRSSIIFVAVVSLLSYGVQAESVQLTGSNFNNIISTHEIVFVNFYADWCRFSQILAPVFDEAAKKVAEKYTEQGKVSFGKVDCDKEGGIATTYHISKYPTLKLFRNGQVVKKEYRGQRSPDALAEFITKQLEDTIKQHTTLEELDSLENGKRNMIGYFSDKSTDSYKTYRRIAMQLRDDCVFHAAVGTVSDKMREGQESKILFRPPKTREEDITYTGEAHNFDVMVQWMHDQCVPLVREITFENAEELTEEGLPFLILFHKAEDTEVVESYTRAVQSELLASKSDINFLTADGGKFTHPLHHLGKTANDLPVLAIDSFRHMYLFKHDIHKDLETPGILKAFIADLHSGKLHREFHHGPDPTDQAAPDAPAIEQQQPDVVDGTTKYPVPEKTSTGAPPGNNEKGTTHLPHDKDSTLNVEQPSSPPESVFKNLKPSDTRYTIVTKDEL